MRLKPLQDIASLLEIITPLDAKGERAIPQRRVATQNADSMSTLKGMLQGVQGAPSRRGRVARDE